MIPADHRNTFRRVLSDLGIGHKVEHAYRPMPRPGEPAILLTDERLRVDRNVFWFGAAFIYGVTAMVTFGALLASRLWPELGVPAEAYSTGALIVSVLAAVMTAVWLMLAARGTYAFPWMNVIIGVGTLLISGFALSAGEFGPIILPFLLAPATAAAFYMPLRDALVHLLLISAVCLTVGLATSGTTPGRVVSVNVLFFTLLAAGLLMVARKRIQDGIRHNVELAGRDPLTGVANLRKFNERLRTEIDRAARSGRPLTLLMIDLDDFKRVNDEHSYTLGDAVLVASAQAMDRVIRSEELLARRGGDEFAVIAAGADHNSGEHLTARIRQAVRRERLRLCPDIAPNASVGAVQWHEGESPEQLIERADRALKRAKQESWDDWPGPDGVRG